MQNLIACWQRSDEEWEANNNNSQHNGPSSGFGGKQVLGNHPKHAFDPTKKPSPPVPPNGLLLPRNSHQPQAKDKQQGEGEKHKHNTRTPKKNCRLSKHKCKRPAMTSTAGNQALSADVTFSKQKMRERERNKRGGEKNIIDNSRIALSLLFAAGSFKVVNQSDHLQNQPNMIPLAKTIIRQVCNKVLLAQQTDLF